MTDSPHWRYRYNNHNEAFEKEDDPALVITTKNEVILRPLVVGVCGSDLSKMAHKIENPHLGHEWVGVIEYIGEEVSDFSLGEIVTSVANLSCGQCKHCLNQNADQCKQRELLGGKQSVLSTQVKILEHDLLKVPQELDLAAITLLEVAYVGDCAFHQAIKIGFNQKKPQQKIVIFGAGPIGLMTALALKERGIETQIIEVEAKRIEVAESLGLKCTSFAVEVIKRDLFGKCDVLFDCTGDASGKGVLKLLPVFAKMDAIVVIVGKYHKADLSESDFGEKSLRVTWVANHQKENFKESISFWKNKISKYSDKMIKSYSFEEINEAFKAAKERQVVKAVLRRENES